MRLAPLVALAWLCLSCLPLAKVAQAATWLGAVIDAADAGARVYHQRHPSLENERSTALAIKRARVAVAGVQAALVAKDSEKLAKARQEAVDAYAALRQLLDASGVLEARSAVGGSETDAPMPEPLPLPSPEAVSEAL